MAVNTRKPFSGGNLRRTQSKIQEESRILARRGSATSVASFGSASSHDGVVTPVELKNPQHHQVTQVSRLLWSGSRPPRLAKLEGLQSTSPIERRDDSSLTPPLNSPDGLSGLVRAHEFTRSWLNDQSVAVETYGDVPAPHASHHTSVTGYTQILEDYPALLSYAIFELFTHAQKADADGLDPSAVVGRLLYGSWDRWKALREDVDERIELLYLATELGLASWLKTDVWRERQIYTAIELAIENKSAVVFRRLLNAFPSARWDTSSMILRLTSAVNAEILQALLAWHPLREHGTRGPVTAKKDILASRNEEGRTALDLVIIQQNIAGVSVLLDHDVDVSAVDCRLRTPLHLACMNQSRRADIRTDMWTEDFLTSDSILAPRSDIIELLLDHGADIDAADEEGRTPLMVACSNSVLPTRQSTGDDFTSTEVPPDGGCFDVVEVLLKRGADAMKKDRMSFLPLHEACWNSSGGRQSKVFVVRKLLDCGSPVNAVGVGCGTPLHVACYSSDVETVEELLRRGADTSLRDHNGRSPLHIAIALSTEQVVETLLSSTGASVDATDNFGSTPLHLACDAGLVADMRRTKTLSIIGRLLAHGAKAYTLRNQVGDLPVDVARRNGFEAALDLLAEKSCDAPPSSYREPP